MDLRQLEILAAVADHRSFSEAARALHTVQSNVSAHIARLEAELGGTLVQRGSGALTESGELVLARYRRIRAEIEAIDADVASSRGEVAGGVRVGVIGTVGRWLVPGLLREVAERHPRISVVVVDATTTSLVPQLAAGTLDLAVVNLPVRDPDVTTEPLMVEHHVLVVPADHPLAGRSGCDIADLSGYPLLLEPPGTGFRDALDADAARAGITLVPAAEVDGLRLVSSIAFEGQMAAVLPASAVPERSAADLQTRRWRRLELTGATPRRVGLGLPTRGLLSAPARAVRDAVAAVLAVEVRDHAGVDLVAIGKNGPD